MFLMNQKGFFVLSEFLKNYPANLIENIIGSVDDAVENDYNAEIKNLCSKYNLAYYDRGNDFSISSNYCFAIGWRWIINTKAKLIVFHDSLLPKYRGFNPLVSCLLNSEKNIGVTALFANDKYDAGEIIMQDSTCIDYPIKIQQAIDKICVLYFNLAKTITNSILEGKQIVSYPQDSTNV